MKKQSPDNRKNITKISSTENQSKSAKNSDERRICPVACHGEPLEKVPRGSRPLGRRAGFHAPPEKERQGVGQSSTPVGRGLPLQVEWGEDLGLSGLPLCQEPWESYFILRRGILPCSYGNPILAPMAGWAEAWNSSKLQEIRRSLSRGKLPAYCLESLGCPIVQRHVEKKLKHPSSDAISPPQRPLFLRLTNRLFFRIPGRIWKLFKERRRR